MNWLATDFGLDAVGASQDPLGPMRARRHRERLQSGLFGSLSDFNVGRSRTPTSSRAHFDRDSSAAPALATNGLKARSPNASAPPPRRSRHREFRATSSAIASDDVNPGLSIPNSWTSPATPCSVGPSMRKSATEARGPPSFGLIPL